MDLGIFFWISWVGVVTRSFRLISTMGLSPLDHFGHRHRQGLHQRSRPKSKDVDEPEIFLDFLGRGSKPVISSHKHHGAISSRSCVFVRIWVYLWILQIRFVDLWIFFGFPGSG